MKCKRCGSKVNDGLCQDATCPFSNHEQRCKAGWNGHPEKDPRPEDDDLPLPCTCKNVRVKAECHSDDYHVEVKFDARKWFEYATDQEILDLAACGWGGDYPADGVAEHMAEVCKHADVQAMFDHIHSHNKEHEDTDGDVCGFECHVDQEAAIRWVGKNRPGILKAVEEACGV